MTGDAVAAYDRAMDRLFRILLFMTQVAEVSTLLRERYGKISRVFGSLARLRNGLMADGAHAFFDGIMNCFSFSHGCMAFSTDAGNFLGTDVAVQKEKRDPHEKNGQKNKEDRADAGYR